MTEYEAERLWTGYDAFLDSIAETGDLEREVAMEVGAF